VAVQTTTDAAESNIRSVANLVWHFLSEHGPTSLAAIAKNVDAPRDMVMQGIGWLVREHKAVFTGPSGKRLLASAGAVESSISELESPAILAVAWDPELITAEEYAELIVALGDVIRAQGGAGIQRVHSQGFTLPISGRVPQ